ncbi:MAG: hypothetical protein R2701_06615 [Acidimicrobiales bacterium]
MALLVASVWCGLRARRWLTLAEGAEAAGPSAERAASWCRGRPRGAALLFRPDVIVAVALSGAALLWGLGRPRWWRWAWGRSRCSPSTWSTCCGPVRRTRSAACSSSRSSTCAGAGPCLARRRGTPSTARCRRWLLRPQPWPVPALRSPAQAFVWFFLLPAATAFIVAVGVWGVRRSPQAWRPRVVLTVGLLGLGLLPQAMQRADTTHLAWVSCVTLTFLPAALAEVLDGRFGARRPHLAPVVAGATVAVLVLAVIPHFTARTYVDLVRQSANGRVFGYPVTYQGRTFYLGAQDIAPAAQRMLEDIGPHMEPGQRLFVGTADLRKTPYSDAYLYYLLPDLTPGTRYIEMDPGMANAPDSGLADEVASSDWLILSHVWDAWDEPNDSRILGPDTPNEVVRTEFCLVGEYRAERGDPATDPVMFEVYRRRGADGECQRLEG